MVRRIALGFLAAASPLVLVTFVLPGDLAALVFALLTMAFPVALIAVATESSGSGRPLRPWLALLLAILEGCTVGMYLLRDRVVDGPWIAGLPAAAALQLYGLWLAPLLLVALVYALTFDRYELPDEELERLRRRPDADRESR